ncbi:MAG: hypothetical protein WC400_02990 [Patescibacteria group bacterium]
MRTTVAGDAGVTAYSIGIAIAIKAEDNANDRTTDQTKQAPPRQTMAQTPPPPEKKGRPTPAMAKTQWHPEIVQMTRSTGF